MWPRTISNTKQGQRSVGCLSMRGPRLPRERGFGRKSRRGSRDLAGAFSATMACIRGASRAVSRTTGGRQCLERVAAPPWARNLKSYENVTSISSVGMVMERKRPKVLITFALTAAERAMCPAKWAAPLAPGSARELLLFYSSASWDTGRRTAAALPLKQARRPVNWGRSPPFVLRV